MPRLIDAEHLKKRATDWWGDCWDNYAQSTEDFLEYIDNEPTVDAVEVVRCKDCVYYNAREGFCEYLSNNYAPTVDMEENDFCSKGKRREDETVYG